MNLSDTERKRRADRMREMQAKRRAQPGLVSWTTLSPPIEKGQIFVGRGKRAMILHWWLIWAVKRLRAH
jgi:hypothetical protein